MSDSDVDYVCTTSVAKKRKLKKEPTAKKTTAKRAKLSKEDKENIEKGTTSKIDVEPDWRDYELLSEDKGIAIPIAQNVIKLFEEGNTIPFIARYRRDATGNMTPEALREVKETYEDICTLRAKIGSVIKAVDKLGQLKPDLLKSMKSSRTIEELEHIYAPYRPGGKRTLAEQAKELGLEEPAMHLLNNTQFVNLFKYIKLGQKGLSKIEEVEKGVVHIIAAVMSTDTDLLTFVRKLRPEVNFVLETKKSATKIETKAKKTDKTGANKPIDETKFETYYDFKIPIKYIKPHQVLAINRGEHHKVLSVKIVVPEFLLHRFSKFCTDKWMKKGPFDQCRQRILNDAIQDAYTRLVQPLVIREIRAELKIKAEKASYEVFSTNLKHLLLAPPLKGKPILGIDPGYSNGCKLAVISSTGTLLGHDVVYPHKHNFKTGDRGQHTLKSMLEEHNCTLIALGNGTACRQTEEWLSNLIQNNFFSPRDVTYTIVNEDGASIYSCSAEAKKEFPSLDPNIISAVSLARRIQEPLAELVKIEPQHIGVGMYQHDLKKKSLEEALDEVVSECVSFVGVDLNTASHCLLRRIAGLTDKRAAQIIEYREGNGPFTYRKELICVKGIGPRIFEQCAGFLRVGPTDANEVSSFYKKPKTSKLDCTIIHPESYDVAKKIIKKFKLNLKDIGEPNFIENIKSNMSTVNAESLATELDSKEETVKLILDALSKPLNHDLRSECSQEPLFKKGLTSVHDITVDTVLTGRVNNVTHFGCFVDIGVGQNGLIHTSKLNGWNLQIGDKVEVNVINIEIAKNRIGLEAVRKL